MDKPWGYQAKWNKLSTRGQNALWFHSYEASKVVRIVAIESREVAGAGGGLESCFTDTELIVLIIFHLRI